MSAEGEEPKPAEAEAEAAEAEEAPADETAASEAETSEEETQEAETAKKKKEDSEELTKRLQKLALERQKQTTGERLKVIQNDATSHLTGAKTFQELSLPKYLLDAIFAMGFDRPSAIQEEALPRILSDPPRNLIGQAQSGSGKTAAFTLGMLYRLEVNDPPTTQALCVTPTRELAIQIFQKAVKPMAANMVGLKIQLAIAGTTIEKGTPLNAHMVIGTPGKVVDWLKRRIINSKTIKVFVLDEADNMVGEDGHRANSLLIKKTLTRNCQCLLFSATFPTEVVKFADKMIHKADKILIESDESLVRCFVLFCVVLFCNCIVMALLWHCYGADLFCFVSNVLFWFWHFGISELRPLHGQSSLTHPPCR
jgi:ATP-dependent RNA helicase DDX19/DBP5